MGSRSASCRTGPPAGPHSFVHRAHTYCLNPPERSLALPSQHRPQANDGTRPRGHRNRRRIALNDFRHIVSEYSEGIDAERSDSTEPTSFRRSQDSQGDS